MQKPSDTMRSFIAIDLPDQLHQGIAETTSILYQRLKQQSPKLCEAVRWVPEENIHLTLYFLGDVKKSSLEEINKQMQMITHQFTPFPIQIGGLGVFPNQQRPRVLWIGVHPSEELISLHRKIFSLIVHFGCKIEDKPFQGHLTIGRVKDDIESTFLKSITNTLLLLNNESKYHNIGTMQVTQIHIYKSTLKPSGPEYSKLYTQPLNYKYL